MCGDIPANRGVGADTNTNICNNRTRPVRKTTEPAICTTVNNKGKSKDDMLNSELVNEN